MATEKCLSCGGEVSKLAKQCPHCGRPNPLVRRWEEMSPKHQRRCQIILLGVLLVPVLFFAVPKIKSAFTGDALRPNDEDDLILHMPQGVRPAAPAKPADPGPDPERVAAFKLWALQNGVVDIAFRYGHDNFFVQYTPGGLLTKPQARSIAEWIARSYCQQTGRRRACCHIWFDGGFVRGVGKR